MTGIMPAATVCSICVDWALPFDCSLAKTRRASTPHVPTALIRWLYASAGVDRPMSFLGAEDVAGTAAEAVADWAGMVLMMAVAAARPATRGTQARFMRACWRGLWGRLTRLCRDRAVLW